VARVFYLQLIIEGIRTEPFLPTGGKDESGPKKLVTKWHAHE